MRYMWNIYLSDQIFHKLYLFMWDFLANVVSGPSWFISSHAMKTDMGFNSDFCMTIGQYI
jgi:hypothetical protein